MFANLNTEQSAALAIGEYVAVDLTENNRPDLGWGVLRHGHGLEQFGDGHMSERVARARADALNQGARPATDVVNREVPYA